MKLRINFLIAFITILGLFSISYNSFGGLGDGHPNDVGSFGQQEENSTPESGGAFSSSTPFENPVQEEQALELLPPDDEVPLDGGASLLIAAGIILGSRHLRQQKKVL